MSNGHARIHFSQYPPPPHPHQIIMPKPTTTTTTKFSNSSSKRRRSPPFFSSFILFVLPTTSLLALFLLLACNGLGLGLLCLSNSLTGNPLVHKHKTPTSIITTNNILALKHEFNTPLLPIPIYPEFHHTLHLSPPHNSNSNNNDHRQPNPKSSTSSRRRRTSNRSLRRGRRKLKFLLHPNNNQSAHFSSRASTFFASSPCHPRFFMTWISPFASFGPRELFSIQSLFSSHPNACLLIVSNTLDSSHGRRLLHPLSARGFRVAALSPDYAYLFNNTPAERWLGGLRTGEVQPGVVPVGQNLSNLLRLVLLYKYGGVYIDTDVIVMRSFSPLRNAIGAQTVDARTGNWTRLNNAVLVFCEGHPLVYSFIEEFSRSFDGSRWGHNGPYLVSRVVSRVAGSPGFEFTVLPPPAFYPVGWSRLGGLFRGPRGETESKWAAAKLRWMWEESFAVHLWNRQSRRLKVEAGSVVGRIMAECCVLCNSSLPAAL